VASLYIQSGVSKFEITCQIREGNSGGPILNDKNELVGMAIEGAEKGSGNNGCLSLSEIMKVISGK